MKNNEESVEGGVRASGRVYRCGQCGYTRYNTTVTIGPDGKVYKNHQCSDTVVHKSYSDDRQRKCLSCSHNQDGACKLSGKQIIDITIAPRESCPESKWQAVERKCPDCGWVFCDKEGAIKCPACPYEAAVASQERRKSPATFIMAADSGFESGLYMAAWSLLKHNDVKLVVMDLGLNLCGNVCSQLREWGVDFVQPEIEIFPMAGWQLYNKPFYIRQAVRDYGNTIWLDCDAYYRDMSELAEMPIGNPLIPDHSGLVNMEFLYRNKDRFYQLGMPSPKKAFKHNESPCTSLVGVTKEHADFVDEWCERTRFAWTSQAIFHASYQDQGILQDMVDFDLIDGRVWNYIDMLNAINPKKKAYFPVTEMVQEIDELHEPNVFHFAGKWKPFKDWESSELDWGWPSSPSSKPNDRAMRRSPFK